MGKEWLFVLVMCAQLGITIAQQPGYIAYPEAPHSEVQSLDDTSGGSGNDGGRELGHLGDYSDWLKDISPHQHFVAKPGGLPPTIAAAGAHVRVPPKPAKAVVHQLHSWSIKKATEPTMAAVAPTKVAATPVKAAVKKATVAPAKQAVTPVKPNARKEAARKAAVAPAKAAVTSGKAAVKKAAVAPAKATVTPSKKAAVAPAKVAVKPAKAAVKKPAITPAKATMTPSKMAVEPAKVVVKPAKVATKPAKAAVTPLKVPIDVAKAAETARLTSKAVHEAASAQATGPSPKQDANVDPMAAELARLEKWTHSP